MNSHSIVPASGARKDPSHPAVLRCGLLLAAAMSIATASAAFIPQLVNSSTIPANGDVNPYGVAFVPSGFPSGGKIASGDVLVSNFNNSSNLQGLGTTIIKLTPTGPVALPQAAVTFFASPLAGLSTALGVLKGGFVLVGNVPTTDGTFGTIGQGAIQVIDKNGSVAATWSDPVDLDGPWDLAIDDHGAQAHVFVSNVLNGTVVRLDVSVSAGGVELKEKTVIGTGYTHAPNTAALVLGPTGLAYDPDSDLLYVASTADNTVYSIPNATRRGNSVKLGSVVFSGSELRGPLALRLAPNGDLLTANGDAVNADVLHPSEIVEFTKQGRFIQEYDVDPTQGGAFGIDTVIFDFDGFFGSPPFSPGGYNYAVIDDITNNLSVYRMTSLP
jgi:hypothetical protein